MNAAEKALEGWDEAHWWQGSAANEDESRVCLMHRLAQVSTAKEFRAARDALYAAIAEQYVEVGGASVGEWNDTPGRTFAEVRAVLEKVAVRLDEAM